METRLAIPTITPTPTATPDIARATAGTREATLANTTKVQAAVTLALTRSPLILTLAVLVRTLNQKTTTTTKAKGITMATPSEF